MKVEHYYETIKNDYNMWRITGMVVFALLLLIQFIMMSLLYSFNVYREPKYLHNLQGFVTLPFVILIASAIFYFILHNDTQKDYLDDIVRMYCYGKDRAAFVVGSWSDLSLKLRTFFLRQLLVEFPEIRDMEIHDVPRWLSVKFGHLKQSKPESEKTEAEPEGEESEEEQKEEEEEDATEVDVEVIELKP